MKSIAEVLGTSLSNIKATTAASISPWAMKPPEIFLELNKLPKHKTHPLIFQDNF